MIARPAENHTVHARAEDVQPVHKEGDEPCDPAALEQLFDACGAVAVAFHMAANLQYLCGGNALRE